jgi:hypothetical protein
MHKGSFFGHVFVLGFLNCWSRDTLWDYVKMSIVTSNIWLFIGVNGIDFVLGLFEMLNWRFPLEVYTFRWRTWDWLKVYADFCKILNSLVFLGLFVYWDCIGILIGSYPYGFLFFIFFTVPRSFDISMKLCAVFSARFWFECVWIWMVTYFAPKIYSA